MTILEPNREAKKTSDNRQGQVADKVPGSQKAEFCVGEMETFFHAW